MAAKYYQLILSAQYSATLAFQVAMNTTPVHRDVTNPQGDCHAYPFSRTCRDLLFEPCRLRPPRAVQPVLQHGDSQLLEPPPIPLSQRGGAAGAEPDAGAARAVAGGIGIPPGERLCPRSRSHFGPAGGAPRKNPGAFQ